MCNNVITRRGSVVTLKQIAEELGVSVSMVSRVLTDKDRVDPEKRKLIKAALAKYNYVPNEMARGLRGISTRSIAIIVPTLSSNYYTNVITAAQEVAQMNDYTFMIFCSNHDGEREKDAVNLIKNKQINKVICASVLSDAREYYKKQFDCNSVVLFDYDSAPDDSIGYISFDSFKSAKTLGAHVASFGHERYLILNHCSATHRQNGFLCALTENGIKTKDICIIPELQTPALGFKACIDVFALPENKRPTAVLATNDYLAYAAIRAIRKCGLSVPDDVSVACFDACDGTGILTPTVTGAMQPTDKIGVLAAKMLIDGKCEHIMLEAELLIGDSCK